MSEPRTAAGLREGTHCGFVFKAGPKCYADEGHPIHHDRWNWLGHTGRSKFDARGPEPDHDYQPESHARGVQMCRLCGSRTPSAPPALDVERLARAMRDTSEAQGEWYCSGCWTTHQKGYALPHTSMAGLLVDDYWRACAESIAAEYDRLEPDA